MFERQQNSSGSQHLYLVSEDASLSEAVASALKAAGAGHTVEPCETLARLGTTLKDSAPALILCDLTEDPGLRLRQIEQVFGAKSDHRVIVLCEETTQELLLEAMQAGARHCIAKQSLATELPRVVERLTAVTASPSNQNKVVTVLSAGGGCGSTTIAINLAEEARLLHPDSQALLVDLDTDYGAIASYLGLSGLYGVVDVLRYSGSADPQLVASTALSYSDNLQVLLSPATIDFASPAEIDYQKLPGAIDACRASFPVTVIDAPRAPLPVACELAAHSTSTLIVFELNVVALRNARSLSSALIRGGVSPDQLVLVANRFNKRSRMLSLTDAKGVLSDLEIASVKNDFESVLRSINFGQPLSQAAPRSGMRRDIQKLLDTIKLGAIRRAS